MALFQQIVFNYKKMYLQLTLAATLYMLNFELALSTNNPPQEHKLKHNFFPMPSSSIREEELSTCMLMHKEIIKIGKYNVWDFER